MAHPRMMGRKIFDVHAHSFPEKIAGKVVKQLEDYYQVAVPGVGTIEALKEYAKNHGVQYFLTFATATKPSQVENINTTIAAQIGNGVFGLGTIHPEYENIDAELTRIHELGLLGIKIHPEFQGIYVDAPEMDAVYDGLAKRDLVLLTHAGDKNVDNSNPPRIASVMSRHTDLKLIAAHFGGYQQWEGAKKLLHGKNVWFDTSSTLAFVDDAYALELIRAHGVEKFLFGSDYPMGRYDYEFARLLGMGLSDRELDMIFFENAKKLFKLDNM
ncbi:MAG: amidohydrolase [Ruminococcaceae bacterium]|nr:amidohydrolase [Oscillospiraceae bacterium]